MKRYFLLICAALAMLGTAVRAQVTANDVVWVQLEVHSSLAEATDRARQYSGRMEDVNGFSLGGGWYAVALGPYVQEDAETVLRVYRQDGLIPSESYIIYTAALENQFWPVGADTLSTLRSEQETTEVTEARIETPVVTSPVVAADEPEETPREARASEARLTRDERKELQIMLQWAGFYRSGIDGAFGRGTRAAMSAWQDANGFEASGVLTTRQRAALKRQYNAVLEGMDLATVTDIEAGIEMVVPRGVVAFEKYQAPFAHYGPTGDLEAKVLMISQPGRRSEPVCALRHHADAGDRAPGRRPQARESGLYAGRTQRPHRLLHPGAADRWRDQGLSPWSGPRATRNAAPVSSTR